MAQEHREALLDAAEEAGFDRDEVEIEEDTRDGEPLLRAKVHDGIEVYGGELAIVDGEAPTEVFEWKAQHIMEETQRVMRQ